MGIDIFNNEEKILINGMCKGEKLSSLTREDVLASLSFSRQVATDGDTMITDLLDGTASKVSAMTDAQWEALKLIVPLPVAQTAEDEVSEVPADEEVTE